MNSIYKFRLSQQRKAARRKALIEFVSFLGVCVMGAIIGIMFADALGLLT